MENLLDILTKYSNLILVIITGIYAYLTWKMVSEMKTARENQSDSNVIAFPILLDQIYTQVQLENAGPGIALDIELSISLIPALTKNTTSWKHPVLLAGQKENFLLPYEAGSKEVETLKQLSKIHDSIVLKLSWKNVFGHKKTFTKKYNLNELSQGWYNAGRLIKPKDIPETMKDISKSLNEIHKDIEGIGRDIRLKPIIENIKKNKTKSSQKKKE